MLEVIIAKQTPSCRFLSSEMRLKNITLEVLHDELTAVCLAIRLKPFSENIIEWFLERYEVIGQTL